MSRNTIISLGATCYPVSCVPTDLRHAPDSRIGVWGGGGAGGGGSEKKVNILCTFCDS